jgi:hypothetical protein
LGEESSPAGQNSALGLLEEASLDRPKIHILLKINWILILVEFGMFLDKNGLEGEGTEIGPT